MSLGLVLAVSGGIVLALVSSYVAFRGWPGAQEQRPPQTVVMDPPAPLPAKKPTVVGGDYPSTPAARRPARRRSAPAAPEPRSRGRRATRPAPTRAAARRAAPRPAAAPPRSRRPAPSKPSPPAPSAPAATPAPVVEVPPAPTAPPPPDPVKQVVDTVEEVVPIDVGGAVDGLVP